MKKNNQKVILLGIDGFDPEVMDFLMKKGKLPAFKKLSEMGSFKKLQTLMPPASPVVWTTIATGVNPGQHGIFDFVHIDRKNYLPHISILKQNGEKYDTVVQAEPFWKILEEKKIATSIIRWPVTFPADSLDGNMLTGLGTPEVGGLLNRYVRFTNRKSIEAVNAERIQHLNVSEKIAEGEFYGPMKDEKIECREPFILRIIGDDKAELQIQEKTYVLKKNKWSDWIAIDFRGKFGKRTSAICKIYVEQLKGEVNFFVTSMQFDPINPAQKISFPENYAAKLSEKIGKFYTLGMPEDARAMNDYNLSAEALKLQIEEIRQEREKIFWLEFEKLQKNKIKMLAFIFDETDRASHMFFAKEVKWKNGKIVKIGKYLEKIYKDKDIFVAKILKLLMDNMSLMIVSDHGFKPFEKKINLNNWLLEQGYLKLKNGFNIKNAGLLYQNVDWTRTRAYASGYFSININLKGREGDGIVSGSEKKSLEKEIMDRITELIDAENKRKVVGCVQAKDQIYYGKQIENAGDILVGFNWPYRIDWNGPAGGFANTVIEKNEKLWQADHLMDPRVVPGIFFSNFKIKKENPNVLDIAPTTMNLLGLNIPRNYEGDILI